MDAIANELYRDINIHNHLNLYLHTKIVIPRLEKIAFLAERFPRILAATAYVASKVWIPIIYPLLTLTKAVLSARHVLKVRNVEANDIFFVNSAISLIVSKNAKFHGKYIYVSKALEARGDIKESLGCVKEYATLADITSALINSMRCMPLIHKNFKTPGSVFQLYPAFDWFLSWSVFHKIAHNANSIWTSSDFDRWAVLIDRLQIRAQKMIVQHGLLVDPAGTSGSRSAAPLPTKLENIYEIFLLNEESGSLYEKMLLAENSSTKFTWDFNKLFHFSNNNVSDNIKIVLIIGQFECLKQECELAIKLAEIFKNSVIHIRPHPSHGSKGYRKILSNKRVSLIEDLHFFPKTNACICFNFSTLAHTYETNGVETIYMNSIVSDPTYFVINYLTQLGFK